jgi:two-component system LytT family response regulator
VYLKRLAVETRGQIRIVPVDRVDFITASGSYAEVHVGDEAYLVNEQMQSLEAQLDPEQFVRIHRSTIVRLDRIETLLVNAGGDYGVCLPDGRCLKVSRRRWDDLVARLGTGFSTP